MIFQKSSIRYLCLGYKRSFGIVKLNTLFIYIQLLLIETNFILKLYFETNLKEAGSEVNSNKTILQLFEYETILIFKLFYWFDYI